MNIMSNSSKYSSRVRPTKISIFRVIYVEHKTFSKYIQKK